MKYLDDTWNKIANASKQPSNANILIERIWAMPDKNTFSIPPIHDLIEEEITNGVWIDPFANSNKFATITNDLNQDYDTDYHMDALDFVKIFDDDSIDGVLYDPPFSSRQVSECYHGFGMNVTSEMTRDSFWGGAEERNFSYS